MTRKRPTKRTVDETALTVMAEMLTQVQSREAAQAAGVYWPTR
jgi:hypothetical protein